MPVKKPCRQMFMTFAAMFTLMEVGQRCASADRSQYVRSPEGTQVPNLALCAKANFPARARSIVRTADVSMRLVISKTGEVNRVENIKVTLVDVIDADRALGTIPLFEEAAKTAFGVRKCPLYYDKNNNPIEYGIEIPLRYEDRLLPAVRPEN